MDKPETGTDRDAPGAEEARPARVEAGALFQTRPQLQGLADDWVALRRDAVVLDLRLTGVEDRLVTIQGRSTGDAHAKLGLLIHLLQHDLGLAPDHRALRLARGALAALEFVHRAVEPAAPAAREIGGALPADQTHATLAAKAVNS